MIYGLPRAPHTKERRITILLLFVYAVVAVILFYSEQNRENVAESNNRMQPQQPKLKPAINPS